MNLILPLLAVIAVSCGNHVGKGGTGSLQQTPSSVTYEVTDEEDAAIDSEEDSPSFNPFFCPDLEDCDLIEAAEENLQKSVSMEVDLGNGSGKATVLIQKDRAGGMKAILKSGRKTHVLYPLSKTDGEAYLLSVCAYDLDGDGVKELMTHNGDLFSLRIFQTDHAAPKLAGSLSCNFGFFVTDDGLIVSRLGSQGLATIARYSKGNLEIIDEEAYIDKLMMASKDYRNLRYRFDDNEMECHEIERIYPADRYIICDQGSIYGDNCFSVDLDGDGSPEQLYLSRPGWGVNSWDEMRVILPGTRTSFSLTDVILEDGDPRAVETKKFDWRFTDLVQLSAKDVDGDGRMEIVASLGSREDHVDYVWSFDRNEGPQFIHKK